MEEAKVLTESFGIMDLLSRPRRDQWGIWNEKKRGMEVSKIVDFDTELFRIMLEHNFPSTAENRAQ